MQRERLRGERDELCGLLLKEQIIRLTLRSGDRIHLAPTPKVVQAFLAEQASIQAELNTMRIQENKWREFAGELAYALIQTLMAANQYTNFRQQDISRLERLFLSLLDQLAAFYEQRERTPEMLVDILRQHGFQVLLLLLGTNGTHFQLVEKDQLMVRQVPCSEYEAPFQLELLGIERERMQEPVLDLGCGSQGRLVQALREQGIEAYGLERTVSRETPFIYGVNWLDFRFVPGKWGTIISNMAFSNHFWHHHIHKAGDYTTYAKKYMEILRSLQVGGSFIYAPGLPFIEPLLKKSEDTYTVRCRKLDPPALKPGLPEDIDASRWYVTQVIRER